MIINEDLIEKVIFVLLGGLVGLMLAYKQLKINRLKKENLELKRKRNSVLELDSVIKIFKAMQNGALLNEEYRAAATLKKNIKVFEELKALKGQY